MQLSLFGSITGINVLPFDGEAVYYEDFLVDTEAMFYFEHLLQEFIYRQVKIHMYDKEVYMPKLTALCGDAAEDFDVSDESLSIQPWSKNLLKLKEKTESITGVTFTHALLNLYRDGNDGVSWHRDKERHWGTDPVIASLSLGAARLFQLRYSENRQIVKSIELKPGSLLIMKGASQRCWEHRIPKTTKRVGPRLNITFRVLDMGHQDQG